MLINGEHDAVRADLDGSESDEASKANSENGGSPEQEVEQRMDFPVVVVAAEAQKAYRLDGPCVFWLSVREVGKLSFDRGDLGNQLRPILHQAD